MTEHFGPKTTQRARDQTQWVEEYILYSQSETRWDLNGEPFDWLWHLVQRHYMLIGHSPGSEPNLCYKKYGHTPQILQQRENTRRTTRGSRTNPLANTIRRGKQLGSSLRGCGPEKCIVVSDEFRSICSHLSCESVQRQCTGIMGNSTRCPSMAAST